MTSPLSDERDQGFAYGSCRDAELFGQDSFNEHLTVWKVTGKDRLLECFCDECRARRQWDWVECQAGRPLALTEQPCRG